MKVAFITGASSGIGAALAREYVKRGWRVAMLARRVDKLEALQKELGPNALALSADVSKDGDLERAVQETVRAFGRIDVAIANAGVGTTGQPFERLSIDVFRGDMETNVFGVLRTAYATLPELEKTKGSFAIVSSVMAYMALPGAASYNTTKAAARALAESMRVDCARRGVNVTHVAPGFIDTELRRRDKSGAFSAEAKDPIPQFLQMPADKAARKIIRSLAWRQRELVLTGVGKIGVFFGMHCAWLTAFVMKLIAKKALSRS